MMKKAIVTSLLLVMIFTLVQGCGGDKTSSDTSTIVKTMDDYRTEAEKDITPDNVEQELKKLQQEIESDIKSGN